MNKLQLASALLLSFLCATSAAAQGIPDNIPDRPGESPADRAEDRLEERYRPTLSRFFATGSFDMAPVTGDGAAMQTNVNIGLSLRSGDALFAFFSTRRLPTDLERPRVGGQDFVYYYGIGYELSAERLLGSASFARRSALNLGLGVRTGGLAAVTLDIAPTYDVFRGDSWSMPVGAKLSLAGMRNRDASITGAFLGLTLGVQRHFGRRDRLESR